MSSSLPDDDDRTVIRPSAPRPAVDAPPAPAAAAAAPATSSANDHATGLPVGTMLGEFELTSVLGEGGFGIVYLAWDHSLERRVALKEYMPSALAARTGPTSVQVRSERHRETFEAGRKSFVNEAKLLAQFDHPSLVKVYRFWEANGTAYMVMPFYEGVTLKDRLRELGSPPDEAWLMDLLAPLTEALAVIHRESCYHRDIAPDNVILLQGSNRPLLLDFGAARRVIGDMTQALTVILKPGYAPVEQYAEAPGMKQGPWTDLYALAASVYFAILGKTPPPSVSRLMGDSYVPLAESCAGRYSPGFLAAIDKALRVRPEDRTQSIAELRADLGLGDMPAGGERTRMGAPADPLAGAGSGAGAGGSSPRTGGAGPASGKPAARPASAAGAGAKLPLIAGGAVTLLALAGGAWWLAGRSPAPAPAAAVANAPAQPSPGATAAPAPAPVAPPAPEPAAQQAPAPAAFDVRAEFDRVLAAQTPGVQVEVTSRKQQLRIGQDRLSFQVKSSIEGDVSVLVLGPDGSLMRLFPNGTLPRVHVKAGQTLQLPPGDVGIEVSEPTGPEQFLVIVSRGARDYTTLSAGTDGGYLNLLTGAAAQAKLAARPASALPALLGEAAGKCTEARCEDFGAARFTLDVTR